MASPGIRYIHLRDFPGIDQPPTFEPSPVIDRIRSTVRRAFSLILRFTGRTVYDDVDLARAAVRWVYVNDRSPASLPVRQNTGGQLTVERMFSLVRSDDYFYPI